MRSVWTILDDDELELGERVMWALAIEVTARGNEWLFKRLVLTDIQEEEDGTIQG